MDQNEKLKQIIEKLKEVQVLTGDLQEQECDPTLTRETDNLVWNLYRDLSAPGPHKTDMSRLIRAYECLDEGFVCLTALNDGLNAYEMEREVARRLALLPPQIEAALAKINIYPMVHSDIADSIHSQKLYEQEQREQDENNEE